MNRSTTRRSFSQPARFARAAAAIALLAIAAIAGARASALADEIAADETPADELAGRPALQLGLAERDGGEILGFIDRERISHARSLSFGYATSTGPSRVEQSVAAYNDFFTYRMRDNLHMALALQYRLESTSGMPRAEDGSFSVLPSFALEYNPSTNTLIRLSYGRLGNASPFSTVRPYGIY